MALSASAFVFYRDDAGLLRGIHVNYDADPSDLAQWFQAFPSHEAFCEGIEALIRAHGQDWDDLAIIDGQASGTAYDEGPMIKETAYVEELPDNYDYLYLANEDHVEVFARGRREVLTTVAYGA